MARPPHRPMPPARHSRLASRRGSLRATAGLAALLAALTVSAATPPKSKAVTEADRQWWAFRPLAAVPPPSAGTPDVPSHPIDRFVTARLTENRLAPNPRADHRTRLRRATFGLTGLPPTPEELDAFAHDPHPDAWSRVIRRLLDSPRHGERWARHWLDVARFAESSGFEHDYDRPHAYHYRDFVIKALNDDMPYDQFVRWQIAGDELAPDNPLALMATGFLGAGVFPTQITANEVERTRYDAMDDMLATTGTAMLGLTIGCARCHDHKADPIPAVDYYRLLSTFTSTVRSDIDLDLDPGESRRAREAHALAHAPLVRERELYEQTELPRLFDQWLAAGAPQAPVATWEILSHGEITSQAGATLSPQDDGSFLASGTNAATDVYTFTAVTSTASLRALRLEALADPSLPGGGPGRADNANIGLSRIRLRVSPAHGGPARDIQLLRPRATFQQNDGNLSIASALDDDPHSGWAVDPQFGRHHAAVFDFAEPVSHDGGTRLEVTLEFALNTRHTIGRPRLAVTAAADPGIEAPDLPAGVADALAAVRHASPDSPALTADQRAALMAWWRTTDPGWRTLQNRVADHEKQAPQPRLTKVMVCAEGYPPVRMHTQGADFFAETHVLARGSTDLKQGVATQGFLQVLMPGPGEETRWQSPPPSGARFSGRRTALARWMTDAEHGAGALVARVIVNRLWQHHFGRGLVTTPNDFGKQGAPPSHPELLEWLASELIRHGWRLKPIHELIMTSEAYQRDAGTREDAARLDPDNSLLARRSPQRLEAEAVRDSLLFVSGALDPALFGPGTLDPASTRRSLYFTVKRSQMIPVLQAFDAPEPLVSQGQRQSTTVAPQALFLMNSPQVRQWATRFAARFAPHADTPAATAVTTAYALALNRPPSPTELEDAASFIVRQTDRHRSNGAPDPRAAALADFAQVILSLNEFIYVD